MVEGVQIFINPLLPFDQYYLSCNIETRKEELVKEQIDMVRIGNRVVVSKEVFEKMKPK